MKRLNGLNTKKQNNMKTKILLSIICACSLFTVQAQVFPESDAIWNIQIDGKEYYYGLSGDTIIDSKSYNKLYLLNDTTLNIDMGDMYIGGLREEEKQVWFIPHEMYDPYKRDYFQLNEYILYDFSKDVGETISLKVPLFQPGDMLLIDFHGLHDFFLTVVKIEDSDIGKTFYLDSENGTKWVEGIGSISNGILWDFYVLPTCCGSRPTVKLACFKHKGNIKYLNNDCGSCFCNQDDVGISNDTKLVSFVFYNRRMSSIQIYTNSKFMYSTFELFNIQGNKIIQENISTTQTSIAINNMQGVYIYRISTPEGEVQIGKIIL